jgi:TPR repeat protein
MLTRAFHPRSAAISLSRCFSTFPQSNTTQSIDSISTKKSEIETLLKQASSDVKRKADEGDPSSQVTLGTVLELGELGAPDFPGAAHYYKLSALQQFPEGLYHYGRILLKGIGVPKDESLGLHFLKQSAGRDYPQAQLQLGNFYFEGTPTIPADKVLAARYFKLAADHGLREAQSSYGFMLLTGDGVDKNEEEALKYFKLSAEQGDPNGSYNYAKRLESNQDVKQAFSYFEKAASGGNVQAMLTVAVMAYQGKGTEKDHKKAVEFVKKAIEGGSIDGHTVLGFFNEQGIEGQKNIDTAVSEFKIAAAGGNVVALAKLGRMYQFGEGVDPDLKQAVKYFKLGADKGDANCANAFAFLASKGHGIVKSAATAVEYFGKAIQGGSTRAMHNLGIMYLKGEGIEKNAQKAVKLFEMAAEKGDPMGLCPSDSRTRTATVSRRTWTRQRNITKKLRIWGSQSRSQCSVD